MVLYGSSVQPRSLQLWITSLKREPMGIVLRMNSFKHSYPKMGQLIFLPSATPANDNKAGVVFHIY